MADDGRAIVEQLLFEYGAIADAKDVPAAVELLRHATVTFPARTASTPDELADHYSGLWGRPEPHRHVITNVRVRATERGYSGQALYTRWEFTPEPLMTTMGEYEMHVSQHDGAWAIDTLVVTRTWQVG